jgi:hypothetical protein
LLPNPTETPSCFASPGPDAAQVPADLPAAEQDEDETDDRPEGQCPDCGGAASAVEIGRHHSGHGQREQPDDCRVGQIGTGESAQPVLEHGCAGQPGRHCEDADPGKPGPA